MLFSVFEVLAHNFFPQWAIYVQDSTSLPNSLGLLTIYAQNINHSAGHKIFYVLVQMDRSNYKYNKEKKMKSDVIFSNY